MSEARKAAKGLFYDFAAQIKTERADADKKKKRMQHKKRKAEVEQPPTVPAKTVVVQAPPPQREAPPMGGHPRCRPGRLVGRTAVARNPIILVKPTDAAHIVAENQAAEAAQAIRAAVAARRTSNSTTEDTESSQSG